MKPNAVQRVAKQRLQQRTPGIDRSNAYSVRSSPLFIAVARSKPRRSTRQMQRRQNAADRVCETPKST